MVRRKAPARKKRLKTLLKADAKSMFGDEDVKMILSHHVSSGLTEKEIAKKYRSTVVSVREWLRRVGLSTKSTRPDVTSRLNRLGYPTWDKFFRRNMAMTYMDAANMLDCHWTSISFWRKRWRDGENI